jgi:hypothetical protein
MDENSQAELLGKKIFFLYPSAFIRNEIAAELTQQEYEVYTAGSHEALRRVLKHYPGSIVFANIDEGMNEKDWETWIRGVTEDPGLNQIKISILSSSGDENLRRKYINSIRVNAGFTVIKPDLNASIKPITEILKAVDARGRRKYIRAAIDNETNTTVNFPLNGTYVNGVIKDISVVGLSCAFDEDPGLEKNALFQNVQVKLQSALLKVEGIIFGSRMDGLSKIYVVLFTQRIDPTVRTKIRKFIQQSLQAKMDAEMR